MLCYVKVNARRMGSENHPTQSSLFVRPLLLIRCELADDDDDAACIGRQHKVILGRFILNPPKTSSSALALANQPLGNGRARRRARRAGLKQAGEKIRLSLVDSPNIGLAALLLLQERRRTVEERKTEEERFLEE